MRLIQVDPKDIVRAWGLLVRHSPGSALPERKFVVADDAARALHEAGIQFVEIPRNGEGTQRDGARPGPRKRLFE